VHQDEQAYNFGCNSRDTSSDFLFAGSWNDYGSSPVQNSYVRWVSQMITEECNSKSISAALTFLEALSPGG
jgi:hypothetical protein